jgi:hypothetical protein
MCREKSAVSLIKKVLILLYRVRIFAAFIILFSFAFSLAFDSFIVNQVWISLVLPYLELTELFEYEY